LKHYYKHKIRAEVNKPDFHIPQISSSVDAVMPLVFNLCKFVIQTQEYNSAVDGMSDCLIPG